MGYVMIKYVAYRVFTYKLNYIDFTQSGGTLIATNGFLCVNKKLYRINANWMDIGCAQF